MSSWISIYCRSSIAEVESHQLARGLRGRDPSALAGVDYLTLAEDYGVDVTLVDAALEALTVRPLRGADSGFEVHYGSETNQVVVVRRWHDADRVAEEIAEVVERRDLPSAAEPRIRDSREVIGIELEKHHLQDMGVVLAYEVARFLAQKGDGLILNDEGTWLRVDDGAFVTIPASSFRR